MAVIPAKRSVERESSGNLRASESGIGFPLDALSRWRE
jgi:hypothetical protein